MSLPDGAIESRLEKLVKMTSEGNGATFKQLAVAAGLNPGVDFKNLDLRNIDFRDDDVSGFDFTGADLTGTDFRRAKLNGTKFNNAILVGAIGLPDEVLSDEFYSPSRAEITQIVKRKIIDGEAVSKEEGRQVTILKFGNTKLRSLAGIENVENLRELSLTGTKVTDLDPLSKLSNIKRLNLDNTAVISLDPLAKCYNLRSLSLRATRVKDLTPIAELEDIRSLVISSDVINNINALKKMMLLDTVSIRSHSVEDISALQNKKLIQRLLITSSSLRDVSSLTGLESLRWFHINSKASEFDCVADMVELTTWSQSGKRLKRLPRISNNLKSLAIWCSINFQSPRFAFDSAISNLNLVDPPIPLLEFLIHDNTASVILGGRSVNDGHLAVIPANIDTLSLRNTSVKDFDIIGKFNKLEYLSIAGSDINDLSFLSQLKHLRNLDLHRSKLKDGVVIPEDPSLSVYMPDGFLRRVSST